MPWSRPATLSHYTNTTALPITDNCCRITLSWYSRHQGRRANAWCLHTRGGGEGSLSDRWCHTTCPWHLSNGMDHRIHPICSYFGLCDGCQHYDHVHTVTCRARYHWNQHKRSALSGIDQHYESASQDKTRCIHRPNVDSATILRQVCMRYNGGSAAVEKANVGNHIFSSLNFCHDTLHLY